MKKVSELIEPGTVLAGKYRVERVLGLGGMGMVVAAQHLQLDEKVAIKLQLPSLVQSPEARARFAREARAAVRIKSEYVARVSDVGHLESGAPYMVMEYLEGEDLAEMLSRGPVPVEQAVEFVLQACEALAEAHALGIIHRDIKPANLFCVRRTDGLLAAKLLDFGVSRANTGSDLGLTSSGVTMGSPHYMAPEQMIAAKNADARSDIWSLGAVLFELVVGEPPFNAETFAELVLQVTGADPKKLAVRLRRVPAGLAQIVLRCLNGEPALRYPSVSELALALVPFGPLGRSQVHADRILRITRTSQHSNLAPNRAARVESPELVDRRGRTFMHFGRTSIESRVPGSQRSRTTVAAAGVGLLVFGVGWWWLASTARMEAAAESSQNAIVPAASLEGRQEVEREAVVSDKALPESTLPATPQSQLAQDQASASPASSRVTRPRKSTGLPPSPAVTAESAPAVQAPAPAQSTDPNKPNLGGRL